MYSKINANALVALVSNIRALVVGSILNRVLGEPEPMNLQAGFDAPPARKQGVPVARGTIEARLIKTHEGRWASIEGTRITPHQPPDSTDGRPESVPIELLSADDLVQIYLRLITLHGATRESVYTETLLKRRTDGDEREPANMDGVRT